MEGLLSTVGEWKTYSALLHFRNWQLRRDIERDFVDLYFRPYADETIDFIPIAEGQAVSARLTELLERIKAPLTQLTAPTLLEEVLTLLSKLPSTVRNAFQLTAGMHIGSKRWYGK